MPMRSSSSASFIEVVVLPEPDGPDSRTMGLFLRFSAISCAALETRA